MSNVTPALLSTSETAKYLGIKVSTLTTWRCTRAVNLPYVKLGKTVRYRVRDLDRFIEENMHSTGVI